MALLDQLAQAISQFEGFFQSGSRAARNNNPGNLIAGPRAVGKDSAGYAIYASPEDGWADLDRQINLDISRGLSLSQFISKYAPASAGNPTQNYIAYVQGQTGVDANVPLVQYTQYIHSPATSPADAIDVSEEGMLPGPDWQTGIDWTTISLGLAGLLVAWLALRE